MPAPGTNDVGAGARESRRSFVGQGVGASHGPEWAGGSVIAATQFPDLPLTLARAGNYEKLITAELDFTAIGARYDVLTSRERLGPGRNVRSVG